ncbi:MAG TPA: hypothetical protein V6C95_19180 [Coleofasciculaceae cyanobacterium]
MINSLLLPLVVGMILFVLNSPLIHIFEGRPAWLRQGLLSPLTKGNRKRCKKLYGNLVDLQKMYLQVNTRILQTHSAEEQLKLRQQLAGLAQQIEEEHEKIEKEQPLQTLPRDIDRVCPTSFGNAYASAEEYSYERYGIDSVLFWTRLRGLMQDKAPGHSLQLTQQKTVLDLAINSAFLSSLLALEAALTMIFSRYHNLLLVLAVTALILSISFYKSSVAAIQVLGELIKTSFDYHRGLVLEAFNLNMPDDLSKEQVIWVKLATFIRRGDAFYFPSEARKPENKNNEVEEEKKTDSNVNLQS